MISWEEYPDANGGGRYPLCASDPSGGGSCHAPDDQDAEDVEEETLSLEEVEKEMIRKGSGEA